MINAVVGASQDSMVHAVLAFCDPKGAYARHAAVVMASIFANTQTPVCVHIIHDETLTGGNMAKLSSVADSFKQSVHFLNVSNMLDENVIDVSKLTIDGARGTLFRLLIPELLDIPKVIYLDCDIIVNLDLSELWKIDIGDHALGAALDVWPLDHLRGEKIPWRLTLAWKALGVNKREYFNAGVLLMNLDKIRAQYDFLGEVGAFYKKYKKMITLADQDCLNHIFAGDVFFVDEKFNRINKPDVSHEETAASIWHMAGGAKPWNLYTRPEIDELYWFYLTMTPYAAETKELISMILKDFSSAAYSHHHSSDCVKRLKKQLFDNIYNAHIRTVPHILMAMLLRGKTRASAKKQ